MANTVLLSSKTAPAQTDRQTDGPSYPTSSVLLWKIVDMANTVFCHVRQPPPRLTDRQTDTTSYPTSSVLLWKIVDMANTVLRSSSAAAKVLQSRSSLLACNSKGYL